MKKWGILLLFLFGCMIHSSGKTRPYFNFKIDGTINLDSGKYISISTRITYLAKQNR